MYRSILTVTSPSDYTVGSSMIPVSNLSELQSHLNTNVKRKKKKTKNNIPTLTTHVIEHMSGIVEYWKQWGFMDKKDALLDICGVLCQELKEIDCTEKQNDGDSYNDEEIPND